jgi:hypothetical protein
MSVAQQSHNPVKKLGEILDVVLSSLGDVTTPKDQTLSLEDMQIILQEYSIGKDDGVIKIYEYIWEDRKDFGEAMHKYIHIAHSVFFRELSRGELFSVVKKAFDEIKRNIRKPSQEYEDLICFFRYIKGGVEIYERREGINHHILRVRQ